MVELDQYYVYAEDGALWLGYSETPGDEGTMVDCLSDVANLQNILDRVRADQEQRTS